MYIIFFIKVKDSNELSIVAHFFSLSSDRLFKRYVSTSLSEGKLILDTTDFFITFP